MSEEPETWQTDALGLLEADPVRPPSEGLARRTRDVARALARSVEAAGVLPVGARVGPYTLGEVLGRGGQATVYRATDDEGRPFAVKVPRPELVSRLAREAQILFHLDHPRIVRIERADMKADPPFIACRLLEGGTLAERLRKGPLSPPDVACLADQILEALIHGHEKGVVHRDLKPSNVLFDAQYDAQVADFGVGSLRLVEEHALGQTLVSVDVTRGAGTPLYMAPEQEQPALRVDGEVDGRADLYALGKLLYEALTGRPPRTIRPVSQLVLGLDRRWDAFLFRLVEDRPQDRYPDAAVAREALRILLRPPGPAEPPGERGQGDPSGGAQGPRAERPAAPRGGGLRRPPRTFVGERLEAIHRALDRLAGDGRAASAALVDDEGHPIVHVGFGPLEARPFAAHVAAVCAEAAQGREGKGEYGLLSFESDATVLTIARVSTGLRVVLIGAGPPHRAALRAGLLELARAVDPGREALRCVALVLRTPEELEPPPPPRRSFAVRAAPIVLVSATALCTGVVVAGKGPTQLLALMGLGFGLLLGLTAGATLWALVTGRTPR